MDKMKKKKYYAVTTSMTFEKTVLIPVEAVKDIDEAIDLVDCGVEVCSIDLLGEDADCQTKPSPYADENGICELSDDEVKVYQILETLRPAAKNSYVSMKEMEE